MKSARQRRADWPGVDHIPTPDGSGGRILRLPAQAAAQSDPLVLLAYGHHSTIERWAPLAQALTAYGEVVVPDLPGFGGMPGPQLASRWLTTAADHLARVAFAQAPRRPVLLAGVSYGFVVVEEALRTHPDLLGRTAVALSIGGFVSVGALRLNALHRRSIRAMGAVTRNPRARDLCQLLARRHAVTATIDRVTGTSVRNADGDRRRARDLRVLDHQLWALNRFDVHWQTLSELLDLPGPRAPLPLTLVHAGDPEDRYVDHHRNIAALAVAFQDVVHIDSGWGAHTPPLDAPVSAYDFLASSSTRAVFEELLTQGSFR